jgi:hypothetical protein
MFGGRLAISADTLAVGATSEMSSANTINGDETDNNASGAGAVFVYRMVNSVWSKEAYIKPSNMDAGDCFGCSISVYGDVMVVGAKYESSPSKVINVGQSTNTLADAGAAYVFRRTGSVWTEEAYLKASNTQLSHRFGVSVAVYGDTIAVGASQDSSSSVTINSGDTDTSAAKAGAVFIFVRNSGTGQWSQQAYIKPFNTGATDTFGSSVGLYGDTLVVGSPQEDGSGIGVNPSSNEGATNSGAAYVFTRSGSTWTQAAYLKASNTVLLHSLRVICVQRAHLYKISYKISGLVYDLYKTTTRFRIGFGEDF